MLHKLKVMYDNKHTYDADIEHLCAPKLACHKRSDAKADAKAHEDEVRGAVSQRHAKDKRGGEQKHNGHAEARSDCVTHTCTAKQPDIMTNCKQESQAVTSAIKD